MADSDIRSTRCWISLIRMIRSLWEHIRARPTPASAIGVAVLAPSNPIIDNRAIDDVCLRILRTIDDYSASRQSFTRDEGSRKGALH